MNNIHPSLTLDEIVKKLKAAKRVLIVGHTNPDGDALGSIAALAGVCEALGCEVKCATPDRPAPRLDFLVRDEYEELKSGKEELFDLICSVDVASYEQLGSLGFLVDKKKLDFMIDHHAEGTPFAPCYIDPEASAAGEIVYDVYRTAQEMYGFDNLPEVSRNVYTAIVSDTGSFKYSNVTPDTHIIASELLEEINGAEDGGMTTDEICRNLFGRRTMSDLKAQALAINKLAVYENGELGVVLLTKEDVTSAGLEESDFGAAVETPRSLDGVKIALSVRQSFADPTVYRVSSRSNCDADVSAVCASFGGGGHVKAAGCKVTAKTPEEALDVVLKAFSAAL
ncbi:MAG: bifunctional oligoribonuclease/PAP phosphatase NrnA [Clostridia bacterium]|nr:bifunctional oligoribonuclease/PAP phosphatase NrnA [Clostridia bacterium]